MTIYAWPTGLYFTDLKWQLVGRPSIQSSPGSNTSLIFELPGACWQATADFGPLEFDLEQELAGLLAAMADFTNYVMLPYVPVYQRRGLAAGTILASGNADAKIVQLAGITGSNPAFRRGDLMTINNRLHRVRDDTNASAGGASVPIYPPLRTTLTSSPVTLASPTCVMRMLDGQQDVGEFSGVGFSQRTVVFYEPLPGP